MSTLNNDNAQGRSGLILGGDRNALWELFEFSQKGVFSNEFILTVNNVKLRTIMTSEFNRYHDVWIDSDGHVTGHTVSSLKKKSKKNRLNLHSLKRPH
jgi:hypothetical protein